MIHLDLDSADTKMLSEILACDLSELGSEISHTDSKDYRDRLRIEQAFLRRLVAQLEASTESEERVLAG